MNQTVVITGATSGIGRHAALFLAERGYRVVATGRREEALAELKAEAKGWLETCRLDVTDEASVAAAVAEVERLTLGDGVDVLINNAGYGHAGPMAEVGDDELRRQFDTNVFGLMAVTRAFVPSMIARGKGRILNVSSVGGRLTLPFMGAYNATKYALESMSDALRLELRPLGIDVVLIEPGVIATGFSERSRTEASKYEDSDSIYAAVLERANAIQERADGMAVSPSHIARAMHRAIRARRPRARYVAPYRTYLFLAFVKLMPTRWVDAIMRRLVYLTPKHLRGAKQQEQRALSSAS